MAFVFMHKETYALSYGGRGTALDQITKAM